METEIPKKKHPRNLQLFGKNSLSVSLNVQKIFFFIYHMTSQPISKIEEKMEESEGNSPATPRKRRLEESFMTLNEGNFGEFLKSRRITFRPDKVREIWEKLSSQLSDEIEKVKFVIAFFCSQFNYSITLKIT